MKSSSRRVVVFVSLVFTLTLTSALLLVLAPSPLQQNATSLMATSGGGGGINAIFATRVPPAANQWTVIYLHQSKTEAGNADTLLQQQGYLGDHFIIGNGSGALDGDILYTSLWNHQRPPIPPGNTQMPPSTISICLIGDFDRAAPTPKQVQRLNLLLEALYKRFGLDRSKVQFMLEGGDRSRLGRYFPADQLR